MRSLTPTERRQIATCHAMIAYTRAMKAAFVAMDAPEAPIAPVAFAGQFDEIIYDLRMEIASIEARPADERHDEMAWVTDAQLSFERGVFS